MLEISGQQRKILNVDLKINLKFKIDLTVVFLLKFYLGLTKEMQRSANMTFQKQLLKLRTTNFRLKSKIFKI